MIKLEMELSDIDYEVLVKEILPKVADRLKQNGSPLAPLLSGGMAANVLLRASDSVRDRMAAEILNAAAPRLTGTLEKLAADKTEEIGIAHADDEAGAQFLLDALRQRGFTGECLTVCYEPVTGSHVGPGTVALFFQGIHR